MKKIPMLDLAAQYAGLKNEIDDAMAEVLASGEYIMGQHVESFENNLAEYLGVKHAIGVASGSDALMLALHAAGIRAGDKVIVPAFTFFSAAAAVVRVGATPVFCDIDFQTFLLDYDMLAQLGADEDCKAVIPVHLFGQACDMAVVMEIAQKHNLLVIEDARHAIDGMAYTENDEKKSGTIGLAGCYSFSPSKNLGGCGDGGMIVTDDDAVADKAHILRMHGARQKHHHEMIGYSSRLDAIQAAILDVKLKYLPEWTEGRQRVAMAYDKAFANEKLEGLMIWPAIEAGHVFHQFVITCPVRDRLAQWLGEKGISTAIYYPEPLHLQPCFKYLGYPAGSLPVAEMAAKQVLALPIDPLLTDESVTYIAESIKAFYKELGRE